MSEEEHVTNLAPVQLLTEKDQVNFLLASRIYLMYKQQVVFLNLNARNTRLLISAIDVERLNVPMEMESGLIVMNITANHIKAVCASGDFSMHLRKRKHAVGDAAFSAYMKNNRTGRRLATCYLMRVEYDEHKIAKHYGHQQHQHSEQLHATSTASTLTSSSSTEDLETMNEHLPSSSPVARDESGQIQTVHSHQPAVSDKVENSHRENNKKKHTGIHHRIRSARKRLINKGKALFNPQKSATDTRVIQVR